MCAASLRNSLCKCRGCKRLVCGQARGPCSHSACFVRRHTHRSPSAVGALCSFLRDSPPSVGYVELQFPAATPAAVGIASKEMPRNKPVGCDGQRPECSKTVNRENPNGARRSSRSHSKGQARGYDEKRSQQDADLATCRPYRTGRLVHALTVPKLGCSTTLNRWWKRRAAAQTYRFLIHYAEGLVVSNIRQFPLLIFGRYLNSSPEKPQRLECPSSGDWTCNPALCVLEMRHRPADSCGFIGPSKET